MRKRRAGMTLVELLVAVAISSLVLAGLGSLIFYTGRW
jgi:prepilin-type N-terminal cleavage/methylation domain-containing protein